MFLNGNVEMNDNGRKKRIEKKATTTTNRRNYLQKCILFHLNIIFLYFVVFVFPHPAFYSNKQKETFFFIFLIYISSTRISIMHTTSKKMGKKTFSSLICSAQHKSSCWQKYMEKKCRQHPRILLFILFFCAKKNPFCVLSYTLMPKGEMKRCCWHPEGLLTWKYTS